MFKFRAVIATAIMSVMVPAFSADIIVESRSGGQNFSGYSEPEGHWLSSNTPANTAKSSAPGLTPQGKIGSRKTVITPEEAGSADKVIASARFKPTITEAGDYHVYLTFPRAANATPVNIYVKSAKGEDRQKIDMDGWGGIGRSNADQWIEVGTYPFTPGADQYVEIQVTGATKAADPRNAVQAYADAVRFSTEPVSNNAPAATPTGSSAVAGSSGSPAGSSNAAPVELQWKSSIADARADASKSGKKILVFFFSPASSRSTDYNQKVLSDPKVKQAIAAGYVPVKINMDTERQLATQLEVFRAGTINIYDAATGAAVKQIGDTPAADELVKQLK